MNQLFWWNLLESFGEQPAVCDPEGKSLSYRQLAELADKSVHDLAAGSLVTIECVNSIGCLAAIVGCLRKRVVPLLIDARLDERLRQSLYENFQISSIWRMVETDRSEWIATPHNRVELHPSLAMLLCTSGSTGSPRLVRLSSTNLHSNAQSIAQYLDIKPSDRPLAHLPIFYSFGLSIVNSHLLRGACLLLTNDGVTERRFWDFFKRHEPTSLSGVPTTFEQLDRLRFERMNLPSLKVMTQAGGKLAPTLVVKFGELMQNKGGNFYVMYGQTEATARISYLPPDQVLLRPASIGKPIPGGRLLLRDESGREIDVPDCQGELYYSGPNVMLGYAESPADLRRGDEQHGLLRTGDLGHRDQDGYYYITGRLKRFIKLFGNRIGLDEVEQILKRQGWDVAAMGNDQQLCIACRAGSTNNHDLSFGEPTDLPAAIKQLTCDLFKLHHSAVKVRLCDEFMLTSSGKPDYQNMLAEWQFH